jgi:hypothetical protein
MHLPYWIFQKYSKQHTNGKIIGLIQAAGTRVAGQANYNDSVSKVEKHIA